MLDHCNCGCRQLLDSLVDVQITVFVISIIDIPIIGSKVDVDLVVVIVVIVGSRRRSNSFKWMLKDDIVDVDFLIHMHG